MLGELPCLDKNKNYKFDVIWRIMYIFVAMKESKNKNKMIVYATDIKSVNIGDEGQEQFEIDAWSYCRYFAENIQLRISENKIDGISLEDYADKVENSEEAFLEKLIAFSHDGKVCDFQLVMHDLYGVNINGWALCNLCMFINEIINHKWVVLLKPTIADTLDRIKDIEEVTITNQDGSKTTSSNNNLKSLVIKALKKGKDSKYEVYGFAKRDKVFTKELMQIEFFYYLSNFFSNFLKIKRRGTITNEESDIIGYFLKWFGLSPTIVSTSRLRQLRMRFDYIGIDNCSQFNIDGKPQLVQWQFIKYADWGKGKLNPLKHKFKPFREGEKVSFPPEIKVLEHFKR